MATMPMERRRKDGAHERRAVPRWPISNRVLCQLGGEDVPYECRSVNLSPCGVCLRSRRPFPQGRLVKLAIFLNDYLPVEVEGSVLWNGVEGDDQLTGISFQADVALQGRIMDYAYERRKNDLVKHWFDGW